MSTFSCESQNKMLVWRGAQIGKVDRNTAADELWRHWGRVRGVQRPPRASGSLMESELLSHWSSGSTRQRCNLRNQASLQQRLFQIIVRKSSPLQTVYPDASRGEQHTTACMCLCLLTEKNKNLKGAKIFVQGSRVYTHILLFCHPTNGLILF